jgi:hypothetical protein
VKQSTTSKAAPVKQSDVLFEVVTKQVLGQVVDKPGGKHPVAAGFELAAESGIAAGHESVEFEWDGMLYTASARPAESVASMSDEEMASMLLNAGWSVYRD